MEGFRRAYRFPRDEWGFWHRRLRALLLVPIVLVPLSLATLVLVFGHAIELWMILNAGHELRSLVLVCGEWRGGRLRLPPAFRCSARFITLARSAESIGRIHAGKVIAVTAERLAATLTFGWYVTRIADYTMFYGSFGAGVATLVWLYITSFTALIGAELNGVLFRERKPAVTFDFEENLFRL